ncbi:hypothetical protein JTE90_010866 [Oedothorax gibbosus]|uniref:Uncharacterized protein n=1 Tax=Oedothorax gibbosus TaxID=931172 RepID=A0AAV6V509_9ARAC|nr:hypothetical protein JTE90_010866 [Oedothorax gibbosus]
MFESGSLTCCGVECAGAEWTVFGTAVGVTHSTTYKGPIGYRCGTTGSDFRLARCIPVEFIADFGHAHFPFDKSGIGQWTRTLTLFIKAEEIGEGISPRYIFKTS